MGPCALGRPVRWPAITYPHQPVVGPSLLFAKDIERIFSAVVASAFTDDLLINAMSRLGWSEISERDATACIETFPEAEIARIYMVAPHWNWRRFFVRYETMRLLRLLGDCGVPLSSYIVTYDFSDFRLIDGWIPLPTHTVPLF